MIVARSLPSAKDAEQQIIGSLLIEPGLLPAVLRTLKLGDFVDPLNRAAFAELVSMHQERTPVDVVSVKHRLETSKVFVENCESITVYLAEAGRAVTTTAHSSYYADLVLEASRKRQLHDIASIAAKHALNGKPSSEVLADLGAALEDLRREADTKLRFQALSAADLDGADFELTWLIDWLLADGQPCILAGPKKALKTSLLCAIGLALATGNDLLGKFRVAGARRFLLCSGESGMGTLQETCRRIAQAMGWNLADIPNFSITADLPRLDSQSDLALFEAFLQEQQAEVVAIDPAYLCMGSADNGNLFVQGELLLNVSRLCQRLGVTLILAHHTRKNRGNNIDQFAPPELEDIAWAGFQEFARQWLLVGRRERYEPGTGQHRLWLSIGGSAGHSGLWALDVDEGTSQAAGGRHWKASLSNASEANEQARQRKVDAKERKQAEQLEADVRAIVEAVNALPDKAGTKTDIKATAGMNQARFDPALATAIRGKHLIPATISKGNNRSYEGYKLGDSDA